MLRAELPVHRNKTLIGRWLMMLGDLAHYVGSLYDDCMMVSGPLVGSGAAARRAIVMPRRL